MVDTQKINKQTSSCPECDTPIMLPQSLATGIIVECPACGTESEIILLHPLKLSPLEEEK